jgi:hypothetical protein
MDPFAVFAVCFPIALIVIVFLVLDAAMPDG